MISLFRNRKYPEKIRVCKRKSKQKHITIFHPGLEFEHTYKKNGWYTPTCTPKLYYGCYRMASGNIQAPKIKFEYSICDAVLQWQSPDLQPLVSLCVLQECYENVTGRRMNNDNSRLPFQQVVAKGMIQRKQGGSIVQISSMTSKLALPGCLIYGGSKAAVDQMMKVMALEWGPHQVS